MLLLFSIPNPTTCRWLTRVVRQENERLMKEQMDRARFGRNYTETASSLLSATTSSLASAAAAVMDARVAAPEEAYAQPLLQEQQGAATLLLAPQQHHLPHLQQIP